MIAQQGKYNYCQKKSIFFLLDLKFVTPYYSSLLIIEMERHSAAPAWRLIGTEPVGVCLHKPCTVSGGGKSELSKSVLYLHGT